MYTEFKAHGTDVDKLCMRYVLDGEAGSNSSELNHAWLHTGIVLASSTTMP